MARHQWTVGDVVFREVSEGTMGQFWHPSLAQAMSEGDEVLFALHGSKATVACEVTRVHEHREKDGLHTALINVQTKGAK